MIAHVAHVAVKLANYLTIHFFEVFVVFVRLFFLSRPLHQVGKDTLQVLDSILGSSDGVVSQIFRLRSWIVVIALTTVTVHGITLLV